MISLYGIKNCDTMKKARRWLEEHVIDYRFNEYRVDGIDIPLINTLIAELGWQPLMNKRGTTRR
ncbi:ArsC/Spx/MgsR family protein, partial [Salmonella enterica]|uniref:ArsC/Spx/MgsR family protein n=1 Tax=Salmonella enterica TaxID=28901 RepID=UPI003296A1DD